MEFDDALSHSAVRLEIEARDARVTVTLDGAVLADTTAPLVVSQTDSPVRRYYVPPADVRRDLLRESATSTHCPLKGDASYLSAQIGATLHDDIAWTYLEPIDAAAGIAGYVSFDGDGVRIDIGPA